MNTDTNGVGGSELERDALVLVADGNNPHPQVTKPVPQAISWEAEGSQGQQFLFDMAS